MSTWYRPPQSFPDLFMNFERVIDKTDAENFELYLLGELNCDLLPDSVNFFYFFFIFIFLFIYSILQIPRLTSIILVQRIKKGD